MCGSFGASTPFAASNFTRLIQPEVVEITKRPEGSLSIMCACGWSCPLKAKLPAGAFADFVGPIFPASFFTSVAAPSLPSARTGSTDTEPPK